VASANQKALLPLNFTFVITCFTLWSELRKETKPGRREVIIRSLGRPDVISTTRGLKLLRIPAELKFRRQFDISGVLQNSNSRWQQLVDVILFSWQGMVNDENGGRTGCSGLWVEVKTLRALKANPSIGFDQSTATAPT